MSWHSILHAPVICPSCGEDIGYCPGESTFFWGQSHVHYWGLGEEVVWLRDEDGVIIPPFKWYRKWGWFGRRADECNFGSPEYQDVIAFDSEIRDLPPESRICPTCQVRYDHIAVMIQGGRLAETRVFTKGKLAMTFGLLDPFPETILVRPDGTYEPRPDWDKVLISPFEP